MIFKISSICSVTNGKGDVKDSQKKGMYPFFDRSKKIKRINEYIFDTEAIIYAGEGSEFYPRYYKGKFGLHQRCYILYDFNKEVIHPKFLYYLLSLYNVYFLNQSVGTTVPSLRIEHFLNLEIDLPNIEKQKKISAILDNYESLIEMNTSTIEDYNIFLKSLYNFKFKNSISNLNFETEVLDKLIYFERGISYTSSELGSNGFKMINLASISVEREYNATALKFLNYEPEIKLKPLDLLIACTDLTSSREIIGSPIFSPYLGSFTFSMDLAKVCFIDNRILPGYLFMCLHDEDYRDYIKGFASGTNVKHLDLNGILWHRIKIPDQKEQQKFSDLVLSISTHISLLSDQIVILNEMKKLTLRKEILG